MEKEAWVKNLLKWGSSVKLEYEKLNEQLNSIQYDNLEQKIYYSWCGQNKLFLNPINDVRTINERELGIFILFISSLTEKQLKKLNNDQPKDYEFNKKYPIIFTKEFKDSLTNRQRYNFCQLRLSSLTRVKVLSDYNKKISNKNMNYKGLYK